MGTTFWFWLAGTYGLIALALLVATLSSEYNHRGRIALSALGTALRFSILWLYYLIRWLTIFFKW